MTFDVPVYPVLTNSARTALNVTFHGARKTVRTFVL